MFVISWKPASDNSAGFAVDFLSDERDRQNTASLFSSGAGADGGCQYGAGGKCFPISGSLRASIPMTMRSGNSVSRQTVISALCSRFRVSGCFPIRSMSFWEPAQWWRLCGSGGRMCWPEAGLSASDFVLFAFAMFSLIAPVKSLSNLHIKIQEGMARGGTDFCRT